MDYQSLRQLIPHRTQQWSTSDVCKWLKFINLDKYIPAFEKLSIDGSCLRLLNQTDLVQQVGVKSKIVIKKFFSWIIFGLQQFDNSFSMGSLQQNRSRVEFDGPTEQTQHTQYPLQNQSFSLKNSVKKKQYNEILVLKRAQGKQNTFYKFKERDCRIGRDQNCQIQINGESIDPFHTHISFRNGNYYLRNLSAQFSTFVKIQTRLTIFDGMQAQMGSNIFRFQLENDLRLTIKVVEGKNIGQVYKYSINKNKIILGRKPGNDICFNKDNTLSNLHARITYSDGFWYLQDLVTTNGSWAQVKQQQRISTGMTIKLGQTNYQFECELRRVKQDQQIQQNVILVPKQNQRCVVCRENTRDIFFVPCSHCAVCEKCAGDLTHCVICSNKISSKSKLFRS